MYRLIARCSSAELLAAPTATIVSLLKARAELPLLRFVGRGQGVPSGVFPRGNGWGGNATASPTRSGIITSACSRALPPSSTLFIPRAVMNFRDFSVEFLDWPCSDSLQTCLRRVRAQTLNYAVAILSVYLPRRTDVVRRTALRSVAARPPAGVSQTGSSTSAHSASLRPASGLHRSYGSSPSPTSCWRG